MTMIYVRSKPGTAVSVHPGGPRIPSDDYIRVNDSRRIRRLIDVHGDLEARDLVSDKKSEPKKKEAPKVEDPK